MPIGSRVSWRKSRGLADLQANAYIMWTYRSKLGRSIVKSHRTWNRVRVFGSVALGLVLIGLVGLAGFSQAAEDPVLTDLRTEIIPAAGTPTDYEIPLSLSSLPQFVEWWYTLVPAVESDPRYVDALSSLVAPCCDDNLAYRCCCEKDGRACNIIRSGKGLAAHLIQDLDYSTDQVTAAVLQWFEFARPDYYLAAEMTDRGMNPAAYGLTTYGSCYRSLCETPISQGGCGGMGELNEPAIETNAS